jgi:Putative restriction endonuclease
VWAHVLPDGATIRVDDATAYEPDALVYCGQELAVSAIKVPEPVIVVEVIPSSRQVDLAIKLAGYFLLPSLAQYLIVDPTRSLILHHSRTGDAILTRVVTEGAIALDPPGVELAWRRSTPAELSDRSPATLVHEGHQCHRSIPVHWEAYGLKVQASCEISGVLSEHSGA